MFVAYVSPQEQRNPAAYSHRYGCTHRCGPAFRVMHNYYFSIGVFGVQGDKKATSAEGVVHTTASSILSHLPVSPWGCAVLPLPH